MCVYYVCAFIILKTNELSYVRMYECTYEYTYHYRVIARKSTEFTLNRGLSIKMKK